MTDRFNILLLRRMLQHFHCPVNRLISCSIVLWSSNFSHQLGELRLPGKELNNFKTFDMCLSLLVDFVNMYLVLLGKLYRYLE